MSQEQIEKYSKKRLMQTSPVYPSTVEALDAAQANLCMDGCDYSCVTEDNRVISFWEYNDITPDKPVQPGQRRVRIPNYPK